MRINKLSLSRETLRRLDGTVLGGIRAGVHATDDGCRSLECPTAECTEAEATCTTKATVIRASAGAGC